jgi:hypothetical protein
MAKLGFIFASDDCQDQQDMSTGNVQVSDVD